MIAFTIIMVENSKKFILNIVDASHVKPLLEKLVAAQPDWRATLMKDWRLKWVNCNIDDEELEIGRAHV